MSKEKTQVIAAVIKRENKYLICQRALNDSYGGLWEFPGGKIRPNESFFDAAKREIMEELGVRVRFLGELLFQHQDPGSSYIINFVEVNIEGEPIPIEHNSIKWETLEDLLFYEFAINDQKFCEYLISRKGENYV
ncbi:MAG: (deoxy)nucleoside triphosphate pyrophosphohydrolase [Anaerolineales bacterium]